MVDSGDPPMSYADIFDRYFVDLSRARDEVVVWWQSLLDAASPTGDTAAAEKAVRARWPLGPCTHPRVVAVFRRYYLEIEAHNETGGGAPPPGETEVLTPAELLFERLAAADDELAAFMQKFAFISIGTDPDGNIA